MADCAADYSWRKNCLHDTSVPFGQFNYADAGWYLLGAVIEGLFEWVVVMRDFVNNYYDKLEINLSDLEN